MTDHAFFGLNVFYLAYLYRENVIILKNVMQYMKQSKVWLQRIIIGLLVFSVALCVYDVCKSSVVHAKEKELPIYSVEREDPVISITFDAAWGDEDLEDILQILEAHNCKATFFVTGDWATRYPDAITKICVAGHELGSHGANHKHMTQLSESEMKQEITDCHEQIKQMTGMDMMLFRAPYGDYNSKVVEVAKTLDYYTIQWDVDSLDWKDYGTDAIVDKVVNHKDLKNGSIILLHNGSKYTAKALDTLLTRLEESGYTFLPVSELIYKDNYWIDHTGRQRENDVVQ